MHISTLYQFTEKKKYFVCFNGYRAFVIRKYDIDRSVCDFDYVFYIFYGCVTSPGFEQIAKFVYPRNVRFSDHFQIFPRATAECFQIIIFNFSTIYHGISFVFPPLATPPFLFTLFYKRVMFDICWPQQTNTDLPYTTPVV